MAVRALPPNIVPLGPGHLMHRFAHRLFGSEPPAAWHSTDGAEMGKMMVAEGLGLTILPDYSVTGDPLERAGLIVARTIAGAPTSVRMVALHRRQGRVPTGVAELLEHLCAQARYTLGSASA